MSKVVCSNCGYELADITRGVKGKADLKCPNCRKISIYADLSTRRKHKAEDDIEITVKVRNSKRNINLPF